MFINKQCPKCKYNKLELTDGGTLLACLGCTYSAPYSDVVPDLKHAGTVYNVCMTLFGCLMLGGPGFLGGIFFERSQHPVPQEKIIYKEPVKKTPELHVYQVWYLNGEKEASDNTITTIEQTARVLNEPFERVENSRSIFKTTERVVSNYKADLTDENTGAVYTARVGMGVVRELK